VEEKVFKRIQFKDILNKLDQNKINADSVFVTSLLIKFLDARSWILDSRKIQSIGFFIPMKNELFVDWMNFKTLALFPVKTDEGMFFAKPNQEIGSKPFLESWEKIQDPDLVLVPGLGFDKLGNRLGRGKGNFDKFLEASKAISVGVALTEQIINKIPVEAGDQKINYILSPQGVWNVGDQKFY
jgi:5,10-methenyltetrahydrofolate synthetase